MVRKHRAEAECAERSRHGLGVRAEANDLAEAEWRPPRSSTGCGIAGTAADRTIGAPGLCVFLIARTSEGLVGGCFIGGGIGGEETGEDPEGVKRAMARGLSGLSAPSLSSHARCGLKTACCARALTLPPKRATGGDGATGGEAAPVSGRGSGAGCWSTSCKRLPRKMLTKLLIASAFLASACGDRSMLRPSAGMAVRLPCLRNAFDGKWCD